MNRIVKLVQKGKTVIGMPQSLWYKDWKKATKEANSWLRDVSSKLGAEGSKKIILTWRQQNSYDKALELYPFVDNR